MKKDAFYFPHDSNAKDDPKCILLIEQLGLEGYGIYWILIETLRDQPGYCYPIQLLPALARRFNTTFEKVKTVVYSYNLFIVNDHLFFSQSLIDRMKILEEKREKQRQRVLKRWEKQKQLAPHENTAVLPHEYYGNTSKVKESKEEIENNSIGDRKNLYEKRDRFSPPSAELVISFFMTEKGINEEDSKYFALRFTNFYESKGWMVGKVKMVNWKSAATKSLEWEDKRYKSSFGYANNIDPDYIKNMIK